MRLNRRLLLTRTLGTLAAVATLAAGPRLALAADDPAVEPVAKLYGKVEEALKGAPDLKSRVDVIGPTILAVFEPSAMLPTAVGPKWKTLKPEQQSKVSEAFNPYLTTLYANRLSQAAGGKFDIKPNTESKGGNKIVHTKVTTKEGDESDVDYVVNGDNKIQDVLLNGNVSEVTSMRASFGEPLKKGGAEALVKFMNERVAGMLAAKPRP